ncbi:MAG: YdjY domain-containing protein [Gemmataceae bacterium]|nr:YdjY domain-containing protein [Gemmataceae bacterium]
MPKTTGFVALALLAALALVPAVSAQPPKDQPKPEELPEFPLLDKANKLDPLSPDKKAVFIETAPDGKDAEGKDKRKVVRVALACEVCLREGPLEQLLCKKGTKEHEAIVRVDVDAVFIHGAILAAGGKSGTPTQFVNPKTEEAEYKPATGSKVNVTVHYKKDGKLHTHPAQEWVWNTKKKAALEHGWVFAGSVFIKNPDDPTAKPFYGANSGDIFSISNFPYSTLEIPAPISKDEAQLNYEAKTDRIPPLGSRVWLILEVVPDKEKK